MMVVINVNNVSRATQGELTRYMTRISSTTYTGIMSNPVLQGIIEKLKQEHEENTDFSVTITWNDSSKEQGIAAKVIGEHSLILKEIDGVLVSAKEKQSLTLEDCYAKDKETKITCLAHALETAVMAETLMTVGRASQIVDALSKETGINRNDIVSTISFFAGIHDIGKVDARFQTKFIKEEMDELKIPVANEEFYRHELAGAETLQNYLESEGFSGVDAYESLIEYHHQGKLHENIGAGHSQATEDDLWTKLQRHEFEIVRQIFPISKDFLLANGVKPDGRKRRTPNIGKFYAMLGIINIADFMASDNEDFDGLVLFTETEEELKQSVNILRKMCLDYITKNHLLYEPLDQQTINNSNYKILAGIDSPRPLQITIKEEMDRIGPNLKMMIVEFPMGEGKTAAGVYAAMQAAEHKSGITFVLPTSATAERMSVSVRNMCNNIGIKDEIPLYTAGAHLLEDNPNINGFCASYYQKQLYPFSVGTVDQIVRSVFRRRYGDEDFIGLSDKAVIIDELHVYDAYMRASICRMAEYFAMYNVPVIILSATIPTATKKQIIKSSGYNNDYIPLDKYPLITEVYQKDGQTVLEQLSEIEIKKTHPKKYKTISCTQNDIQNRMLTDAIKRIKNGGVAMLRMNRVNDVISLYEQAMSIKPEDTEIEIIHGRMFQGSKSHKIDELEKKYGEKKDIRPKKALIICSNILDFSINITVDFLFTEICPIDSLLQVSGRLRRYPDVGTIYETNPNADDTVFVYTPIEEKYYIRSKVYNETLLKNTIDTITKHNVINMTDIRTVMNEVYDRQNYEQHQYENNILRNKSETRILPPPTESSEWFGSHYSDFKTKYPETRYSTYEKADVIFLTEDEANQILSWNEKTIKSQKNYIDRLSMERKITIPASEEVKTLKENEQFNHIFDELLYVAICNVTNGIWACRIGNSTIKIHPDKGLTIE